MPETPPEPIDPRETRSEPLPTVSVAYHNRVVARGRKRALELEPKLAAICEQVIRQAADVAASNFERMVTNHLTASAEVERATIDDSFLRDLAKAFAGPIVDPDAPADHLGVTLPAAAFGDLVAKARALLASISLTASAPGVTGTSTMVCLYPLPEEADALYQGGEEPENLHVTLAFLGDTEGELEEVRGLLAQVAGSHAPLHGAVGGIGRFADMGDGAPLIALPDVPGLIELRHAVTERLAQAQTADYSREHGFTAHTTLDYSTDPKAIPGKGVIGQPLTFDAIHLVRGDETLAAFPLTGVKPLTAAIGPGENFCLTAALRDKTDPVRRAVIETMTRTGVEGAGLSFDVTNPFIDKALANTASHITSIAGTTQADVMRVVRASYEQGLSIPDTAKAIREAIAGSSQERATLIARTELAGAVNGGSLAATQVVAAATGDSYLKEWLTAPGARYPRHELYEGLDGQKRPLHDYFDVGGEALQYPGDPEGECWNTCNCRCALVYDEASNLEASAALRDVAEYVEFVGFREEELDMKKKGMTETFPQTISALTAAGPATWSAPAPEEVLAVDCGGENYRIPHQAPGPESGVPMHDLAGGTIYPADIYDTATQLQYYGTGEAALDRPTFALINEVRGNPDAEVTIYRGVPADVHEINPGDWVTPSKAYAELHAASEQDWHVISMRVRAGDLYTQGDSINEWGWAPKAEGSLGALEPTTASGNSFDLMDKVYQPPNANYRLQDAVDHINQALVDLDAAGPREITRIIEDAKGIRAAASLALNDDGVMVLSIGSTIKGGGTALIQDAVRTAVEAGTRRVYLAAEPDSVPFYEKLGFTKASAVPRLTGTTGMELKGEAFDRLLGARSSLRPVPPVGTSITARALDPGVDPDFAALLPEHARVPIAQMTVADAKAQLKRLRNYRSSLANHLKHGEVRKLGAEKVAAMDERIAALTDYVKTGVEPPVAPETLAEMRARQQAVAPAEVRTELAQAVDKIAAKVDLPRLTGQEGVVRRDFVSPAQQAAQDQILNAGTLIERDIAMRTAPLQMKIDEAEALSLKADDLGAQLAKVYEKGVGEIYDADAQLLILLNGLRQEIAIERYGRGMVLLSPDESMVVFREARASAAYREADAKIQTMRDELTAISRPMQDEVQKTRSEAAALRKGVEATRQQVVLDTLNEIRPMGGANWQFLTRRGKGVKSLTDAAKFYPREWIERTGPIEVQFKSGSRGWHRDRLGGQHKILTNGTQGTSIHELGHAQEINGEILSAEQAFYEWRIRGGSWNGERESLKPMGAGYRGDEQGRDDAFPTRYFGKDYGGHAYEILTMGLQSLWTGRYTLDPEYLRFILGLLALA